MQPATPPELRQAELNAQQLIFNRRINGGHFQMKTIALCGAIAISLIVAADTADAKGCIKGAIVGGAAGHYAGHHGAAGAGIGCAIGHHEAKKHEREQQAPSQSH
jgi:hypothetical protein